MIDTSNYLDYVVTLEATTEVDDQGNGTGEITFLDSDPSNKMLNYLRFIAVIHTFKGRNRNKRLWKPVFVRTAMKDELFQDKLKNGLGGEAGHPIPAVGQPTIERILTIDPNNVSHIFEKFEWVGDEALKAQIVTLDDGPGQPGDKLARFIRQGFIPGWSCRAVIPQRKNLDGSSDQTGPGIITTWDRVYGPSCRGAYVDGSIPVKEIAKKSTFESVLESVYKKSTDYIVDSSKKVNRILDNMYPVMESAMIDADASLHIKNEDGDTLIIPTEREIRCDVKNFISKFM